MEFPNLFCRFGLTDEVGHLERYLDRVLDEAAERAVFLVPRCLIDKLLDLGAVAEKAKAS